MSEMLLFIEEGGIFVFVSFFFFFFIYIVIPIGIYNKNMIYTII